MRDHALVVRQPRWSFCDHFSVPQAPTLFVRKPIMSIAEEARVGEKQQNGSQKESANGQSHLDAELLINALTMLRKGDFSVRLPTNWTGLDGKVADTFNDVMDQLQGMTNEVDRISRV